MESRWAAMPPESPGAVLTWDLIAEAARRMHTRHSPADPFVTVYAGADWIARLRAKDLLIPVAPRANPLRDGEREQVGWLLIDDAPVYLSGSPRCVLFRQSGAAVLLTKEESANNDA